MTPALIQGLLHDHARTFALTLNLLPRVLREPLGSTYLLARASDTVADAVQIPRERRLQILEGLKAELRAKSDPNGSSGVDGTLESFLRIRSGEISGPEGQLIAAVPGLFVQLQGRVDREELLGLWRTILEGQLFDLRRFSCGDKPLTREELESYCGLVAGSVGETWTRLIALHCPDVLRLPLVEMTTLGIAYGKGLQLTNILRDRSADFALGRVYAPQGELRDLFNLAGVWLDQGREYVVHLRGGRLRYASALPLALAKRTLRKVRNFPDAPSISISRREVCAALLMLIPSLGLPRGTNPAS
jgi:farnesyl-diphosphate farnesyltransferase